MSHGIIVTNVVFIFIIMAVIIIITDAEILSTIQKHHKLQDAGVFF
jgi:hypothetical protein